MSDKPKEEFEAAAKKKGSCSGDSKPNVFSLETSKPSSNPIALSTLERSSGTDKKIKTGPKAVLRGAVAQQTSTSNGKSMSTQNTLTEVANGIEGTNGNHYRRRTVTTPKFISEPLPTTTKKISFSLGDNKAKNQSNTSATSTSLNISEPSVLPVSMKSSNSDRKMEIETNSVLPGEVAKTAAPDEGFKEYQYQRKISASSVNSRATGHKKIGTNSVLPGAVADTAAPDEGFKEYQYQRKIAASSVNSRATDNKKFGTNPVLPGAVADTAAPDEGFKEYKYQRKIAVSSVNESATNETSFSLSGNFAYNEGAASTFTSWENSEASALPSSFESSEVDKKMKIGTESHSSNAYSGQQSFDDKAHKEACFPETEHEPLEMLQDNVRYISQDNSNTTDTQGLVVATLVESNRNVLGTDVIVDAIPVDEKPTTWYKDRQILLIIGIFVIVAMAVSVSATVLLLDESFNESSDVDNVRILKALYDSTDGPNWFTGWDFSSELSYCYFHGISCDYSDQIYEIYLDNNGLRGSLPSDIGMLSSLEGLELDNNSITGTIPSEIGILPSLEYLNLSSNSITGTIPMELCALTNTWILYDGSEISCTCIDNSYRGGTTCY